MPLLSEVAAYLATQGVTGVKIGFLPDLPDVGTVIYEYGGGGPELGFGSDPHAIKYETPTVQLVVRGAPDDYNGPRARIETAYRILAGVQTMTLSGTFYHWIRPKQSPFLFNRDEKRRVLFAVNFDIEKELSVA